MSEESARPLGELLRLRREELGISLEQAQADTRIRAQYLSALEAEDYGTLPDPIVGRGFLRNYAAYLGLDTQHVVRLYGEKVPPPEPILLPSDETNPFTATRFEPVPLHEMPGRRSRWVWLAPIVIVILAALALLAWWGYPWLSPWLEWMGIGRTASTPTLSAENALRLTASQMPTLTPLATDTSLPATPAAATPTLKPLATATLAPSRTPTPTSAIYTGVFMELLFTDASWIQIAVDGIRQFQGTLPAGTYRSWYGDSQIELRIGNAGAVTVTVNGQNLGTLGAVGEVVDRVFEKVGQQVIQNTSTPGGPASGAATPSQPPTPPQASVGTATVKPSASPTSTPPPVATTP